MIKPSPKKTAQRDIRNVPAYTAVEAASYLHLPPSTVRSWAFGRTYSVRSEKKKFAPIIQVADKKFRLLSFKNLVELHVISALRRKHKVKLEDIRKAVVFVKKELNSKHPLLEPKLAIDDNKNLLVEILERIFNISKEHQLEMKQVIFKYMQRVERDTNGVPVKLFPVHPGAVNERAVEINPQIKFGRPCLIDKGIPVDIINDRFVAGETIRDIAEDYDIGVDEVEAAIRFTSGPLAA